MTTNAATYAGEIWCSSMILVHSMHDYGDRLIYFVVFLMGKGEGGAEGVPIYVIQRNIATVALSVVRYVVCNILRRFKKHVCMHA